MREPKSYTNTTIVGFPAAPTITIMGDKIIIAGQATPEEQF